MENRKLCEAPYNKTVDWAKWYIFWADERVVAKNHADSNYKLAKDGLFSKVCYLSHASALFFPQISSFLNILIECVDFGLEAYDAFLVPSIQYFLITKMRRGEERK